MSLIQPKKFRTWEIGLFQMQIAINSLGYLALMDLDKWYKSAHAKCYIYRDGRKSGFFQSPDSGLSPDFDGKSPDFPDLKYQPQ